MLIELSNDKINFNTINVNSNSINKLTPEDYIFRFDNESYNKVTKEIIYNDFLDHSFLFNHNLRNFSIKYPKDNTTVFYTKTSEFGEWKITVYDNSTSTERALDPSESDDLELFDKYKIEDCSITVFEKHLGKIPFTKKNEDINFKTIKKDLLSDLENMYNKEFEEIITIQYALKNNLEFIIVEEFSPELLTDKMELVDFHSYVFKNINIFNKYKNVETAIQELFLKKSLGIELPSLKKYNSIFSGKLAMPGLYLYKYMVNYMKLLNEKSIPARVLKKRGRKPKKKPEEEQNSETKNAAQTEGTKDDK